MPFPLIVVFFLFHVFVVFMMFGMIGFPLTISLQSSRIPSAQKEMRISGV